MQGKTINKVFIILFAVLYLCVCGVSLMHAINFFGLANNYFLSCVLATTFEIGQAAVLFSILTGNGGKNKIIPWLLMIILTSVQVMGNVYSSYKYLIENNEGNLRFFKEPIFVWTNNFPDAQCNVILSYIMGAILPIVALLLTSLVTNYIGVKEEKVVEPVVKEEEPIAQEKVEEPVVEEEPIAQEKPIEEVTVPEKDSRFINL